MPTFAYSGRTRGGENVTGERIADTMDAAVAALRREQIMVTRIVHPDPTRLGMAPLPTPPNTPEQDVATAAAGWRMDRKVHRLILDSECIA